MPGHGGYRPEGGRGLIGQTENIDFISPFIRTHEVRNTPLGSIRPVEFRQPGNLSFVHRSLHGQVPQMKMGGDDRRMRPAVTMIDYLHNSCAVSFFTSITMWFKFFKNASFFRPCRYFSQSTK